jgi:hypothetical protein
VRPREAEASFQMHARGVLALPVGTQAQVKRLGLRIAEKMMFMVPPYAVRAGTPGASARGADLQGQHESSVREGVSLGFWQPLAHALKSQVVCWDERQGSRR